MENLKLKHIVLSPSYPQNSQEFKDVWVNIFLEIFKNSTINYSIFLEHPDSNCHLDVLIWIPQKRDYSNWYRDSKLKKTIKDFLDANPASNFQEFYYVSKVPQKEEDNLYLIGYNQKECQGLHNLPLDYVQRGVEYYEENKKTKRLRKFMTTNTLNPKNVVCYMLEHSQSNNIKEYKNLLNSMVSEGFSFVGLAEKPMLKSKLEWLKRTGQKLTKSQEYDFLKLNGAYDEIEKEDWWINLKNKELKYDKIQQIIYNQGTQSFSWDHGVNYEKLSPKEQIKQINAIISENPTFFLINP